MSGPQGFPLVTVEGTEDDVVDFLEEYCGGDHEQALDLFEMAAPTGIEGEVRITIDWVPRGSR